MGKGMGNFGSRVGAFVGMMSDQFFDYDTPKMVQIKSKKVGLINRVVQICVIAYVVIYVLIINKDYQKRDDVEGSATAKLKGVAYTNITDAPDLQIEDPTPYNRVWDLADYVIPPQVRTAGSRIKLSFFSRLSLHIFSLFFKSLFVLHGFSARSISSLPLCAFTLRRV